MPGIFFRDEFAIQIFHSKNLGYHCPDPARPELHRHNELDRPPAFKSDAFCSMLFQSYWPPLNRNFLRHEPFPKTTRDD